MSKKQRNRLVHSYFDNGIGKHQIFVYNKNHDVIAHLMISTIGCIEVFQGTIEGTKRVDSLDTKGESK